MAESKSATLLSRIVSSGIRPTACGRIQSEYTARPARRFGRQTARCGYDLFFGHAQVLIVSAHRRHRCTDRPNHSSVPISNGSRDAGYAGEEFFAIHCNAIPPHRAQFGNERIIEIGIGLDVVRLLRLKNGAWLPHASQLLRARASANHTMPTGRSGLAAHFK
jgi:hypothetical protein